MNRLDTDITKGGRRLMIRELEAMGCFSHKVLTALGSVQRHLFVDEGLQSFAYENRPLAIAAGQTISHPSTVAMQTTLLDIKSGDRILEVGTGCGYQTAVLYFLGADVYSIERQQELWKIARNNMQNLGYQADDAPNNTIESEREWIVNNHIRLRWGDGYNGWEEYAPFDGIIVTCAAPEIPQRLLEQLKVGGKLVIPVNTGNNEKPSMPQIRNQQELLLVERLDASSYKRKVCGKVSFVDMLHGTELDKSTETI